MFTGKVSLVGAGPGDPGLITVKGVSVIQRADIILHDYHIHPNILALAKPDAQVIHVGKKGRSHYQKQEKINTMMKQYVQEGLWVARVKSGDPCIFGRVGEEMEYCVQNQILFEVIPGVTSASAAAIYAGIPVTHRTLSRSVAYVTGTLKTGGSISFKQIPEADTLVILMCVFHIAGIIAELQKLSKFNENTPLAIISYGTMAKQFVIQSTIGKILTDSNTQNIAPLSLMIVGDVATKQKMLNWRHGQPLFGQRIVFLREKIQTLDSSQSLIDLGADIVHYPMIKTIEKQNELHKITENYIANYAIIIFSSSTAVRYVMKALFQNGGDARCFFNKYVLCVGKKTAETLLNYGVRADAIPDQCQQEGLVDLLKKKTIESKKIWVPTSEGTRSELEKELKNLGADVCIQKIYKTVYANPKPIQLCDGDNVVFTSQSTATYFFTQSEYSNQKIIAYCIGDITKSVVEKYIEGSNIRKSDVVSVEGVIEKIKKDYGVI